MVSMPQKTGKHTVAFCRFFQYNAIIKSISKFQFVERVQIRTAPHLAPAFKRGLSAKLTGGVVAQHEFVGEAQ